MRNIKDAVVTLQLLWGFLADQWSKNHPDGPRIILTQVHRTAAEQAAYFAQGRKPLAEINKLRAAANLPAIGPKEAKRIITYKQAGGSKHERMPSQAIDIGFVDKNGNLDWDSGHFDEAARLVRNKFPGVTWGGDWDGDGSTKDERFVDRPHFEV